MNLRLFTIHKVLRAYKFVGQHAFIRPLLARKAFEALANFLPGKIEGCEYESIKIGAIEAEWITPKNCNEDKVLLFLHGGGYATGSIHTHRGLASQIGIHAGVKVLSINYRLAPEHKFPKQIDDAVDAFKYLLQQGFKASHIAIGGESAGGGLSAGTLLYLRDHDLPLPACCILMSPWLDLTDNVASMSFDHHKDPMIPYHGLALWAKNYASEKNLKNPYASPIFGDLEGLCPIYIQAGDCEILMEDSKRFAAKAKKAGVQVKLEIWKDMFHAWQGFWMVLPEGMEANKKLGKFLKDKLANKSLVLRKAA